MRSEATFRFRRPAPAPRPIRSPRSSAVVQDGSGFEPPDRSLDQASLLRIFDVREDGAVTLKMLPAGPDTNTDALLLLLYGYYRLKNEEYVLATQLFRAAAQSGIALRRSANEYARHSRFVVRGGHRKGSHYSLSSQGLAMARELTARISSGRLCRVIPLANGSGLGRPDDRLRRNQDP